MWSCFNEGLCSFSVKSKWGFVDKNGNVVIQPKYDFASGFHEGLAVVRMNNKYGFIDKNGSLIIECKFQDATDFHEGVARIEINNKVGYINNLGRIIISPIYDNGSHFNGGVAMISSISKSNNMQFWGLINKQGKKLIKPKYLDIRGDIIDNSYVFSMDGMAIIQIDKYDVIIDTNGIEYYYGNKKKESPKNLSTNEIVKQKLAASIETNTFDNPSLKDAVLSYLFNILMKDKRMQYGLHDFYVEGFDLSKKSDREIGSLVYIWNSIIKNRNKILYKK